MTPAGSSEPPEPPRGEAQLWPTLAAGGAGLAALAFFALQGAIGGAGAVIAMLGVAGVTAAALILADRRSEADQASRWRDAGQRSGEALPYAALLDSLPDPILVVRGRRPGDMTRRRYVFANLAARELYRITTPDGLLVNLVRDPQLLDAVEQALFHGRETQVVHATGGAAPRTFRAIARPIPETSHGANLALVSLHDETELRQLERTRVDFIANASHELRTPLASLSGFIETLRGHARADPVAQERFLGIMQGQAERMSRLIDDLMALSRIELAEHLAPTDTADLGSVVSDVVDALSPLAAERGVSLKPELQGAGTAVVRGDRDQLVQVAQNLVHNALKYSPEGGRVRISIDVGLSGRAACAPVRPHAPCRVLLAPELAGATYAVLRVRDDGAGIAREHLGRLTERFYRVEGQKSGERSGTGLGLAIVKHIVRRHRGGLQVESLEGEGTIFTVCLPEAGGDAAGLRRQTVMEV